MSSPASTRRRATSSRCTSTEPISKTLTYRVSFGEADSDGRQALQAARSHRRRGARGLRSRRNSCWKAGRASRPARATSGSGQDASPTRSTSTCRCSRIVNAAVKNGTAVDLSAWRPEDAQEQLRQHDRRVDRAGGLPPASAAAARCPHRRLVRHETRHGRGRLAADQPRRAPHDVADLLARRHPLLQIPPTPGTRPRTSTPTASTSATTLPPSSRPAGPQTTPRATARRWPGSCSPTSCPTW